MIGRFARTFSALVVATVGLWPATASAQVIPPEAVFVTISGRACGGPEAAGSSACLIYSQPLSDVLVILSNKTTSSALGQVRTDADGRYRWAGSVKDGDVVHWQLIGVDASLDWSPTAATYEKQAVKTDPTLWSADFVQAAPPADNYHWWEFPDGEGFTTGTTFAGFVSTQGVHGPELMSGQQAMQELLAKSSPARVPSGSMLGGRAKLITTAVQALGLGAVIFVKLYNPSSTNDVAVHYNDPEGNLATHVIPPGQQTELEALSTGEIAVDDGRAVILETGHAGYSTPTYDPGSPYAEPGCWSSPPVAEAVNLVCTYHHTTMPNVDYGLGNGLSTTPDMTLAQVNGLWPLQNNTMPNRHYWDSGQWSTFQNNVVDQPSRYWVRVWPEGSAVVARQLEIRLRCQFDQANPTDWSTLQGAFDWWAQPYSECWRQTVALDPAQIPPSGVVTFGPITVQPGALGQPGALLEARLVPADASLYDAETGWWNATAPIVQPSANGIASIELSVQWSAVAANPTPQPIPQPDPVLQPQLEAGIAPNAVTPAGAPVHITNTVDIQWPWCLADLVACMELMFVPQRTFTDRLTETQQALQLREPFAAAGATQETIGGLFGFLTADFLKLCVPMLETELAAQGITQVRPCVTITQEWTVYGWQPLRIIYVLTSLVILWLWFNFARSKVAELLSQAS